jgi:TolB protein
MMAQINYTEKQLTLEKGDDRAARYSPDAQRIVFESNRDGNWEIFLMDIDGKNVINLSQHSANDRNPFWHPKGKKIVFESDREGINQLFEINLGEKKIKKIQLPDLKGTPTFATYSPDGKKIAFSLKQSDNCYNICLTSKNGTKLKMLTQDTVRTLYTTWSPNSKELIYFSRKDTKNSNDELYKHQLSDNQVIRLTQYEKHDFCPAWSKNGKMIAYVTSFGEDRSEIVIMQLSTKQIIRVTNNKDGETQPGWHPFDNKLLITAYRNGSFEICEIELNGL